MSNRGEITMSENESPEPIVVATPHLKAGLVVCRSQEQVARVRGMDQFAQWIREEVRA